MSRERLTFFRTLVAALPLIAGCAAIETPEWRTLRPVSDFGLHILDVYSDLIWWTGESSSSSSCSCCTP